MSNRVGKAIKALHSQDEGMSGELVIGLAVEEAEKD